MRKYCPECGAELIPNTEFCRICGAPVPKDSFKDNILKNKNFKYGLLIIVAIVIVGMVLVTANSIMNSDTGSGVDITDTSSSDAGVASSVDSGSSDESVDENTSSSSTSNLVVNDLNGRRSVDALEDHLYGVRGTLVADKDYDYLEMTVVYYDDEGNMLTQDPYAWSASSISQGDSVDISCESLVDGKAASAKVYIFDTVSDGDLSNAIWSGDCEMPTDAETPGANTGNLF